ncbi:MAG: PspC domain-containing protein [Bacteroidota bacterium]
MNKTVTINLSGIIFHIDEDAYQKLNTYLNTIRGYFSESEGRDEIMADIENRIAEMLSEKITDKKQVAVMTDIDRVIELLGNPEDFATDRESLSEEKKKEKPSVSFTSKRRRIFRNPDDKVLGGVCGGIAAYFDFDVLWLRLLVVLLFFGFGSGLLIYIILWIIIPLAKTSAEKLEMRGETVNVSNIGKTVEEELSQLKKKIEDLKNETYSHGDKQKIKDNTNRFVDFCSSVFSWFFRSFGKFIGIILIVVALCFLIGILSSIFGIMNIFHIESHHFSNLFLSKELFSIIFTSNQMILTTIGLILFLGVPLLMIIYGGFKLLLGIKTKNKIVKIIATIMWLVGLAICLMVGIQMNNQFSNKATIRKKIHIQQPKGDTIFLKGKFFDEEMEEDEDHDASIRINQWHLITVDGEKINFGFPRMNIVKSKTDSFELTIIYSAYGTDKKIAHEIANNIIYEVTQNDSVLEFDSYFTISKKDKWKKQKVEMILKVPKNKVIYVGDEMENIIFDNDNVSNTLDNDMIDHFWKMTTDGLMCLDCLQEKKIKKHCVWWKRIKHHIETDDDE